jgi:hypothetical protein
MVTWLLGIPDLLKSFFGLAEKGIDFYIKRADGDTQRAIKLMEADQARIQAQRDITIAGMNHPIWWAAWIGFTFPLIVYWNKIIIHDKVLEWGRTDPLDGFVLDWAGWIVGGLFCLQVGTGIVGGILNRVVKR